MISRRNLCIGGAVAALLPALPARAGVAPKSFAELRGRALAAFEQHRDAIVEQGRIGIVDFSQHSRKPRFHILDMKGGTQYSLLVAHGKGSDPDHSGWLERFSNKPGSEASSAGAYLTGQPYSGKHGRSRRLIGLDSSNSNAEGRAIVIHGAWYVSPGMIRDHGKLGRSQGCLAVAEGELDMVLNALLLGSLIYVDKL